MDDAIVCVHVWRWWEKMYGTFLSHNNDSNDCANKEKFHLLKLTDWNAWPTIDGIEFGCNTRCANVITDSN